MSLENLFNDELETADIDMLGRCIRYTFKNMTGKISQYANLKLRDIVSDLRIIAESTKDKDAVIEAAKTIWRYNENVSIARYITNVLRNIAESTKDKNKIINAARIMSLDEIVNTAGKAGVNYFYLTQIAAYTEDKDAVIEAAKTIGKYDGDAIGSIVARDIAGELGIIAEKTKDKDAVIEAAKTIGKYNENLYIAQNITGVLRSIAENTKNKLTVMTACRVINLAGWDISDMLKAEDFNTIRKRKLDELINDKESIDSVVAYLKSGLKLPVPTKENIKNYKDVASEYVSKEYGINKHLNINQILMLFSVDEYNRKELVELINRSDETELKTYSVSAEGTKRLEIDRNKLPYLSVISITRSKDKNIDKEAYKLISKIVGEKAVEKARNEFNSHYKNKIKEIASYLNKGNTDNAIELLKTMKNESIDDVLGCINYSDRGFTVGKVVLRAVESNNPLDYDNRVQIACVYLPRNFEDGIYNYCKDYKSEDREKGFILVRYDIGGKALGSAICYMEDSTFLVDSVEGHRTFRKPQVFKAVYQDLIARAEEKGAKIAIFSNSGTNETPRKFIDFLRDMGLKQVSIKMKLNTNSYLEANKNNVSGYIVRFKS